MPDDWPGLLPVKAKGQSDDWPGLTTPSSRATGNPGPASARPAARGAITGQQVPSGSVGGAGVGVSMDLPDISTPAGQKAKGIYRKAQTDEFTKRLADQWAEARRVKNREQAMAENIASEGKNDYGAMLTDLAHRAVRTFHAGVTTPITTGHLGNPTEESSYLFPQSMQNAQDAGPGLWPAVGRFANDLPTMGAMAFALKHPGTTIPGGQGIPAAQGGAQILDQFGAGVKEKVDKGDYGGAAFDLGLVGAGAALHGGVKTPDFLTRLKEGKSPKAPVEPTTPTEPNSVQAEFDNLLKAPVKATAKTIAKPKPTTTTRKAASGKTTVEGGPEAQAAASEVPTIAAKSKIPSKPAKTSTVSTKPDAVSAVEPIPVDAYPAAEKALIAAHDGGLISEGKGVGAVQSALKVGLPEATRMVDRFWVENAGRKPGGVAEYGASQTKTEVVPEKPKGAAVAKPTVPQIIKPKATAKAPSVVEPTSAPSSVPDILDGMDSVFVRRDTPAFAKLEKAGAEVASKMDAGGKPVSHPDMTPEQMKEFQSAYKANKKVQAAPPAVRSLADIAAERAGKAAQRKALIEQGKVKPLTAPQKAASDGLLREMKALDAEAASHPDTAKPAPDSTTVKPKSKGGRLFSGPGALFDNPDNEPLLQSDKAKAVAGKVSDAISGMMEAAKGTGRFHTSYTQGSKDVGNSVNKLAVIHDVAMAESEFAKRNVMGKLSDAQKDDLGRLIVSERLKATNPSHSQVLDPSEQSRIMSDPTILEAARTFASDVVPRVRDVSIGAGVKESSTKGKGPLFAHLVPVTEKSPITGESPRASVASRLRQKKSGFAQKATGTAEEYSTDLGHIIDVSFGRDMPKAALRDVYAKLKLAGLMKKTAEPGYKAIEIQQVPIAGKPGVYRTIKAWVPEGIATDIEDARNIGKLSPSRTEKVMQSYQRFTTGMALTGNPFEVAGHMHRQLSVLSKMPAENAHPLMRVAEPVLNMVTGGANLGTKGGSMARVMSRDWSTPEMQQLGRDIMESGGGTSRAFKKYTVSKIPGVGNVQSYVHDFLFGIPKGKGMGGWDMRVRGELEMIRRAVEKNKDPQRTRDFLNQVGQYTDKPSKSIDRLKWFNPFLASQLPMRVTEIKQGLGFTGLKPGTPTKAMATHFESVMRGGGSAIVGLFLANRYLSGHGDMDKGHWPTENRPGHEWDLDLGNGEYLKGSQMEPDAWRALNTVGIPGVIREKRLMGKGIPALDIGAQTGLQSLTGPLNVGQQIMEGSPAANVPLRMAGIAPYLTKKAGSRHLTLMDTGQIPPKGRSQLAENTIDALKSLNPLFEYIPTGGEDKSPGVPSWLAPLKRRYISSPSPGNTNTDKAIALKGAIKEKTADMLHQALQKARSGKANPPLPEWAKEYNRRSRQINVDR